jgi:hypothetical protein
MDINIDEKLQNIKQNKKFDDLKLLKKYLNYLFYDLMSREEESTNGLYKLYFYDIFRLPLVISENLMRIFTNGTKSFISRAEFISGMMNLLTADFYALLKIFFKLCDFDNDGIVQVADLSLIINYLYTDINCHVIIHFQIYLLEYNSNCLNKLSFTEFTTLMIEKNVIFDILKKILDGVPITTDSIKVLKIEELKKSSNQKNSNLDFKTNLKDFFLSKKQEDILDDENIADDTYRTAHDVPVFNPKMNLINLNVTQFNKENTFYENLEENKITNFSEKTSSSSVGKLCKKDLQSTSTAFSLSNNSLISIVSQVNPQSSNSISFCTKTEKVENKINLHNFKITKEMSKVQTVHLKFSSTHDGYIYKLTKNNKKIKKYWVVLINYDLFYFNSKKTKFKGLRNLSKCFTELGLKVIINEANFYSFLLHTYKIKRTYYCDTFEECKKWIQTLKEVTKYRNIEEFYEISNKILGKGHYGEVQLGINKKSNEKVAIKIIEKKTKHLKEIISIQRESEITKKCKHKNIVKYIDLFESKDYIFLILEYIPGVNLKLFLNNQTELLNEEIIKNILYQICKGLQHLSNLCIVHRDIKPENIMVVETEGEESIKIIDFGLSVIVGKGNTITQNCGTVAYSAPEVVQKKAYNREVDIWSLGVLLFYFVSGSYPFGSSENSLIILENENFEIISKNLNMNGLIWDFVSPLAIDLIKRCLSHQLKRITLEKIFEHPWIQMRKSLNK